MWENTVITDAGITLVAGLMAGGTIRVSSVKSGAGAVESDVLKEQTTVSQPKQTAAIQKIEKVNDYIQLSVLFTNQGLAASYGMKQVGIFVESEGQEILFAISQTEIAKEIPSETVSPSYSLVQKFRFQFKRDISMTAIIDPEGLCSMELYQELEDRVEEIESPSFETADTRMNIFSEDGLSVILGKLQKWYEDFAQIAFSGSYEDLSDKPGIANNLTTTTDGSVLDARQGKILAERIGALNDLTTEEKGAIVAALNELNSKIEIKNSPDLSQYNNYIGSCIINTQNINVDGTNYDGIVIHSQADENFGTRIFMAWNRVMAFQTKVSGTWGTWNSIAQNSKIPSGNFAKVNSVVPVKVIDGYVFIGEIPFLNADKYNIAVISIATVTGGSKATFSFNINKTPFGFNAYTNNTDAIYWVSTYLKEGMGAVDFTANYKG